MKFQDLFAYQKPVVLAMDVYETSKAFPKEETYSRTDQIRRSSRSVSANIYEEQYDKLIIDGEEVGKLVNYMILNPHKFEVRPNN